MLVAYNVSFLVLTAFLTVVKESEKGHFWFDFKPFTRSLATFFWKL